MKNGDKTRQKNKKSEWLKMQQPIALKAKKYFIRRGSTTKNLEKIKY